MNAEILASSPAWSTRIWLGAAFEAIHSYHGDVFRGLNCLCHISLTGIYDDEAAGRKAVAAVALKWIDAFQKRSA